MTESKPTAVDFHEAVELPAGSIGKKGERWEIVILEFGKSKRAPGYVHTKEAADRSLAAFEGAKIYALRNSDDHGHVTNPAKKSTRDIVGVVANVRSTDKDLRGDAVLLPSAGWLKENLAFAESQGIPMPYELSIDAAGAAKPGIWQGEKAILVESYKQASVDVVEKGAAGGRLVKMVASQTHNTHQEGETPMKNKLMLLFSLLYPQFLESKKVDLAAVDENELFTHLLEAEKAQPRLHLPDGAQLTEELVDGAMKKIREAIDGAGNNMQKFLEALEKMKPADDKGKAKEEDPVIKSMRESQQRMDEQLKIMRIQASTATMESELAKSKLPAALQDEVREQMKPRIQESKEAFTSADVTAVIDRVRKVYGRMIESNPLNNRGLDIGIGMEQHDKVVAGLMGFFLDDPNMPKAAQLKESERKDLLKGIPAFRSIKEAYVQFTGDVHVTGERRNSRLTESLQTTDWANIVADVMNKRLVREYNAMGLDTWRAFVDVVPVSDFKPQHRYRYGGYSNLPTRAQGMPYAPLTSPGEEHVSYTPSTRGGTEDLTRELIMNDDVKAARNIPQRMARAAAQTVHEFVYALIDPAVNAAIWDTVALYHANHANTGTAALDAAGLKAARLRMKKQSQLTNSKRLGIRPGFLIVPPDLEDTAYGLITPAFNKSNQVPEFLQQIGITPIVVDYWTDATNWALVARREDLVCVELGFINGQEMPEMFVSDVANVGSWFTNDKITYKIRHEYGAAVVDYRGLDGSIVAG